MTILKEFRDFILKGNPIDLAVGVLIGGVFGKLVDAFTSGIIKPVIGSLAGKPEVSLQWWIFDIGLVLNALISLLITGAVLFFVFIKPMNKLKERTSKQAAPPPPEPSAQEKLLAEIRDLLKQRGA